MKAKERQRRARRERAQLQQINLFAAGIDIGSRSHFWRCRRI